jgi:hypothetical protein
MPANPRERAAPPPETGPDFRDRDAPAAPKRGFDGAPFGSRLPAPRRRAVRPHRTLQSS